jgi:hypothetical protein
MYSNPLFRQARLQVRNGSRKPAWFDAAAAHRPFEIGWTRYSKNDPARPKELVFPEDRLRQKYEKFYINESSLYVVDQIPGENMWFQHPADVFSSKQLRLMENENLTEDEAFGIVAQEKAEREYSLELEEKYAKAEAEAMGIKVRPPPPQSGAMNDETADELNRQNLYKINIF